MNKKIVLKVLSLVCALGGFGLLAYVFAPIIAYEITAPRFSSYLSPIPPEEQNFLGASTALASVDYTKASNWFEGDTDSSFDSNNNIAFYTMSIPRLGIKNAAVSIGGEDLSKSLIHYPGTAAPGNLGNAVIFGHSILPQFYNPKDYMAIFSTLHSLRKGDEVLVNYDGVSYQFRVEDRFEVQPTDIQILEQNPSDSFLTLVTCSPPGHPGRPRRLIVRARVVPV